MTHPFMTSAFNSASGQTSKGKNPRRSSKLNNSHPSLFDAEPPTLVPCVAKAVVEACEDVPLWQAVAVDFDGEEHAVYVEAGSESEANEEAARAFEADGVAIYQMFIYKF